MAVTVLSAAPVGARFKVVKVLLDREVGRRLADMGFTEGAEGEVIRGGFMRGPLQVSIRGYDILIRRCEAAGIEVEPIGDWLPVAARPWTEGFGGFHGFRGFRPFGGRGGGHGDGLGHGRGNGRGQGGGR